MSDWRRFYRSQNGVKRSIEINSIAHVLELAKARLARLLVDGTRLLKAEEQFLLETGLILGTFKHLGREDRDQLTVDCMSTEAVTTSEIEGEILDRASVQSSIRRHLGLATDKRRPRPAEEGIAEVMVDVHRGFSKPLSDEMLFQWHGMVVRGRRDLRDVGRYRTDEEPMQVVSGAIHAPRVHFEALPSKAAPREMKRFVKWFNRTDPSGAEPLPTLPGRGLRIFHFVSIHPFEDGNGRIGRAIAEKALAQGRHQPTLIALAATILARRKQYYAALEAANKKNEITAWLQWLAGVAIEAQRRTIARAEFLIDKARLLDSLRGQLNARQKKRCSGCCARGRKGSRAVSARASIPASPARRRRPLRATLRIWSTKALSRALASIVTPATTSRFRRGRYRRR